MPTLKTFAKFVGMYIAASVVVNGFIRPVAQKSGLPFISKI